jgi:hypothetical protein
VSFLSSRPFWRETAVRAAKTFGQALLALVAADAADLIHASWVRLLAITAGIAAASVLTSVVAGSATKQAGEAKAARRALARTHGPVAAFTPGKADPGSVGSNYARTVPEPPNTR